jgi:hypothetical protein
MKPILTFTTLVASLLAAVGGTQISPRNGAPPMDPSVIVAPIDLSGFPGYKPSLVNVSVIDIPDFRIHNILKVETGFQEGLAVFNGKDVPVRLILAPALVDSPFKVIHDVTLKRALLIDGEFISGSVECHGIEGSSGLTIPILSLKYHHFMTNGQEKSAAKRGAPTPYPAHEILTANSTAPEVKKDKMAPKALVQGALVAGKFVTGPLATFKLDSIQITRGHFDGGAISHTNGSFAHLTGVQSMIAQAKKNPPFRYVKAEQIKKDFGAVKLIDHDFDMLNLQFKDGRIINGAYVNSSIPSAIFHHGYLAFMAIHQPHNQTVHQFWNRAKLA